MIDPGAVDRLMVEVFLGSYAEAPAEIVLDLDATDGSRTPWPFTRAFPAPPKPGRSGRKCFPIRINSASLPNYNYYVISAIAKAGQYQPALDWMRKYWGGMVRRGATSFWEAYAPGLPMHGWRRRLGADFGQGYFVSLAHGWSSGPTIWLMQEILGIKPNAAGFERVSIRPELAGLEWVRGTEPTPGGLIKVDYRTSASGQLTAAIDLLPGTDAAISMPVTKGETTIRVHGAARQGIAAEGGRRAIIHLDRAGHYTLTAK